MICAKVRRLLSAYLDAELPADRRGAVRRHLRECDDCQGVLDSFKNLGRLSEKWAELQPAADLWQTLGAKLTAACAAVIVVEEVTSAPEACRGSSSTRRSYKPAVEGLEDRYAMSQWLCAAAVAIVTAPIAPALASWWPDQVPCESSRAERERKSAQFPGQALFLHWFSPAEVNDFAALAVSA